MAAPCDVCNGEGKIWLDYGNWHVSRPCADCDGDGWIYESDEENADSD